jgi:hypothetical protein
LYSLCVYGSAGTPAEGACHGCAVRENKQTTTSVLIEVTRDPALADAIQHRCERVSEEARLAHLLNDLNRNLIDDTIGDVG